MSVLLRLPLHEAGVEVVDAEQLQGSPADPLGKGGVAGRAAQERGL